MITKTITLNSFPVCVKKSGRACTDYHNHKYYELVYVLEGMVDHIINGEHHVLREGNYVLLSPSDGHMYVSVNDAPFGVINFMFDPVLIDSNFSLDTPFNEIIKHPLIGMSAKKLTSLPLAMQFSDDSRSLRAVFTDSLTEYKQKKFGYVNTSYFNRVFKNYTGMTPTEFINALTGKDDSAELSSFKKYYNDYLDLNRYPIRESLEYMQGLKDALNPLEH